MARLSAAERAVRELKKLVAQSDGNGFTLEITTFEMDSEGRQTTKVVLGSTIRQTGTR
jgi:hypothetical protein